MVSKMKMTTMVKMKVKENTMMKMMMHSAGVYVPLNMICYLLEYMCFLRYFQTLEKNRRNWIATEQKHTFSLHVTNTWSLIKQYTSPKIQWAKNTDDLTKQLLLQNLLQPLLPESRLVQCQIDLS